MMYKYYCSTPPGPGTVPPGIFITRYTKEFFITKEKLTEEQIVKYGLLYAGEVEG